MRKFNNDEIYVWAFSYGDTCHTTPVLKLAEDTRVYHKFAVLKTQIVDGIKRLAVPLEPTGEILRAHKKTGTIIGYHGSPMTYSLIDCNQRIVNYHIANFN